jgi:uncharacterized lipoprotein YddW (UPF0748 family)
MKQLMSKIFLMSMLLMISCIYSQNREIRGVWLTNVDSRVLESRERISEAMQFLADHNFNLVCPVVWNKGMTQYRSQVMDSLFGMPIDPLYGDRDPLAEVIAEAHKRNIAVIAWFEFGFASSYQENGGHLLARFPDWAARDIEGNLLEKNGFEWMNAFHPDVQNFILSLIKEVVQNYQVDGIQGDDRLPAQPAHGGYSDYTVKLYQAEHGGASPPKQYNDPDWMRWRGNILNRFAGDIYRAVKTINYDILVTWAPSIYPWSFEEYLQDWPAWIREGHADLLFSQNYRYTLEEYIDVLNQQVQIAGKISQVQDKIYSGVLINVADYVIPEDFLLEAVQFNRTKGIKGEVFFFYEGLRKNDDALARMLAKSVYKEKAVLPFIPRFQK